MKEVEVDALGSMGLVVRTSSARGRKVTLNVKLFLRLVLPRPSGRDSGVRGAGERKKVWEGGEGGGGF